MSPVTVLVIASWSSYRAGELDHFWMTLNQMCCKTTFFSNYCQAFSTWEQTRTNLN